MRRVKPVHIELSCAIWTLIASVFRHKALRIAMRADYSFSFPMYLSRILLRSCFLHCVFSLQNSCRFDGLAVEDLAEASPDLLKQISKYCAYVIQWPFSLLPLGLSGEDN